MHRNVLLISPKRRAGVVSIREGYWARRLVWVSWIPSELLLQCVWDFVWFYFVRVHPFVFPLLDRSSDVFFFQALYFLLLLVSFSPFFGECQCAIHPCQFHVCISSQLFQHADPHLDLLPFVHQLFDLRMLSLHLPCARVSYPTRLLCCFDQACVVVVHADLSTRRRTSAMARDRTTSGCVFQSFPHVLCAMTSTTPTMRTKTRPRRRWKRCDETRGCVECQPQASVAMPAKFVSMPLRDVEESNMHGNRRKTKRKERQVQ